jgi:hypothetical protein
VAAPVQDGAGDEAEARRILQQLGRECPFGPVFFLSQLRGLVRERCPDPSEALPAVEIHLQSGVSLEVCHVIGVSPRWVALAVHDEGRPGGAMRTDLVAYELIVRVSVRAVRPSEPSVGFRQAADPAVIPRSMTPSDALRIVATATE